MSDYLNRVEWLAAKRLPDPELRSYVAHPDPQIPLTRHQFHALKNGLAARVSWDAFGGGHRITFYVDYVGGFGWSVVEHDSRTGRTGVVVSPRSYAGCVAYITNCIAPDRLWDGRNLTVDQIV